MCVCVCVVTDVQLDDRLPEFSPWWPKRHSAGWLLLCIYSDLWEEKHVTSGDSCSNAQTAWSCTFASTEIFTTSSSPFLVFYIAQCFCLHLIVLCFSSFYFVKHFITYKESWLNINVKEADTLGEVKNKRLSAQWNKQNTWRICVVVVAVVTWLTCTPVPVCSAWWPRLGDCGRRTSPDLPEPVETPWSD